MIGEMVRYAADRAMSGAVESALRKASWGGVAIFMLAVGAVFTVIVVFWILDAYFGATIGGILTAAGCFVIGVGCLMMPRFLDWLETKPKQQTDSVSETVTAVQDEVAAAVDYFGPIRVVSSGFLMGLGLARSLKR